jgi:hypothetical protein
MNLVQINERLKDLPMQVVQQYANGMNPEVPPYLALGELQRRELSQKQMATAQGGAQGPQPSIKEQVEQKAGLMALQQMQQQQVAQQQAQPQGPMPVPAGVPQPQQQPEAMMARGGLASIPVRSDMFEYAGGGIIAFAKGETVEDPRRKRKEGESFADFRKRMFDLDLQLQREKNASESSGREAERQRLLAERGNEVIPPSPFMERPPLPAPSQSSANATSETMKRVGPMTAPKFEDPRMPAGLPGAAQQMSDKPAQKPPLAAPKPPVAAAPAPAAAPQTGLPGAAAAMSPQDEVAKLSMEAVREKAKAMTPEEAMAQEGKFASQYGLDKKFGEEERGLLALMKQRQADFAKRRPMEELGATLRGFGQGYGGASAAGERAGRETYEMDMANQREALNAINALNKENLATGKERYKFGSGLFGKSEESAAAANQQRTQTLGQMRGQDITAAESAANRLNNLEVEKLRNAERRAERTQPGSASMVRAEYLKMMDQVFALEDKGEKAQADALRRRAEARLTAGGGASAAGVGAGPKPMTRDQALKTVGDILENPMMSRGFIADAKAGLTAQGIANPTMIQIQEYLVQQHMKGADLAAPTQTGLPSGVTVKRVGP